jgi:hypothetical protein
MAIIGAFDAAIKAGHGQDYDPSKFRPDVSEVANGTFKRLRANLIKTRKRLAPTMAMPARRAAC